MTESILKIETDRVRVAEWRLLPGDQTGYHKHGYDYIVVPLTGGELTIEDAGGNRINLLPLWERRTQDQKGSSTTSVI